MPVVDSRIVTLEMQERIRAWIPKFTCIDDFGYRYPAVIEERKDDGNVLVHWLGFSRRWDQWIDTTAEGHRFQQYDKDGDWQLLFRATRDG